MKQVSRILVGIDLHREAPVLLDKAGRLAEALGASVELYAPVYNSLVSRAHFREPDALRQARQRLVDAGLARLEEMAGGLSVAAGVHCDASWDHPREEALIRRALHGGADLVMWATHPDGDRRFHFLSGGDWQLVRHCPAPLLLCAPAPWRASPTVVAALDPGHPHGGDSRLDQRILAAAGALSGAWGGELRAFHAFEAIAHGPGPGVHIELPVDAAEARLESGRARALESLFKETGVRPDRVDLQEGPPADRLPDYCRDVGADVVVMGAIARNPLGRIFVGSTAERVMHRLPCDLLVIKPEGFAPPVSETPWTDEQMPGPVVGVPGI
ncbi:MAG: universal stress protein [Gammaproteobacteria bacterium]